MFILVALSVGAVICTAILWVAVNIDHRRHRAEENETMANEKSKPRAVDYGKSFVIPQGEPLRYADGPLEFIEDKDIPGLYRADIRSWFKDTDPAARNGNHKGDGNGPTS